MAEFVLSDVALGTLAALSVGLRVEPGTTASWHLQRVVVSSSSNKCWTFPCGDWLGGSAGNPLQRVLVASRCAALLGFRVNITTLNPKGLATRSDRLHRGCWWIRGALPI